MEEKKTKKNALKGTVKYLREISVVVIGVAITFIASDWISGKNEKKDLQRYLNAVKLELQENLVTIQDEANRYGQAVQFSRYLNSGKRENLQADSLAKYSNVVGDLYSATHNTSAFEMLKTSGAMRLIKDDTLLMSIISCYTLLEDAVVARDKYLQRKMDELFNTILNNSMDTDNTDMLNNFKHTRLFNFYAIEIDVATSFKDCARQIEKTLTLF